MENTYTEYPYGEFPYRYTKEGQKELMDNLKKGVTTQNTPPQNSQNNQNNFQSNNTINNQNNNTNGSNQSVNTLQQNPISQGLGGMLGGFDISKFLPMMFRKNTKSTDLINLLTPMLGNNGLPLKEMLNNTLQDKKSVQQEIPVSENKPNIGAGYKIVE